MKKAHLLTLDLRVLVADNRVERVSHNVLWPIRYHIVPWLLMILDPNYHNRMILHLKYVNLILDG